MEKENSTPPQIPPTPPQVVGKPDESAINRALGSDDSETNKQPVAGSTRIWKFGKQVDILFRHRKYIKDRKWIDEKTSPETIKHVSHGRSKGCQCAACKVYRKEYEDVPSEAGKKVEPVSVPIIDTIPTEKNPKITVVDHRNLEATELEDLLDDVVDEETAAVLLDTFRKAGEVYVRGKNLGKYVENIWAQDEKEMRILGKLGKRVWDRYASIPKWKHKEAALLGIYMAQSVGLRVTATLRIMKEEKQ